MHLCENHTIGSKTREQVISPGVCPALSPYGIALTGLSDAWDGFCFVRPHPRASQILFCSSGTGEVLIDGTWVSCGPGFVYATPPYVLHGYRAIPESRWRVGWVAYRPDWREGPLSEVARPTLAAFETRSLSDAIGGLYRESHWAYLIHRQARRLIGAGTPPDPLGALWEQVDTQLAHPWTVANLAEIVGMSGEHLRRLCLQKIGRSPMRQVTHLRMRRASALLALQSYTVETIARFIGYDNPFAFSVAFKREMGRPPSEYRAWSEDKERAFPNSSLGNDAVPGDRR
jgi:AraC-like DNA-binding protein